MKLLLLCLAVAFMLFGCQSSGRTRPHWIIDRNTPATDEYIYADQTGHEIFLGWVYADAGHQPERWLAVYYDDVWVGVRTEYYPTRELARQAIENWYGKVRR